MSVIFSENTWTELKEAIEKDTLILLPVGTVEEHGLHLPVETDARIAWEFAKAIATELRDELPIMTMEPIWTGYSAKEMAKWPGTIRVRTRVVMDLVYDVVASLIDMGFRKIVILDSHGHHSGILNVVSREIADAFGVYIAVTAPATLTREAFQKVRKSGRGGSVHGGEWETSLMLYLTDKVREDLYTDEDIMRYHSEFIAGDNFFGGQKVTWSTWGIQKSKTGIYGDPGKATKEIGEIIFRSGVEEYKKFIREFYRNNSNSR